MNLLTTHSLKRSSYGIQREKTMTPPIITDSDFTNFTEFFYRKTGILFEDSKRYFVDKRLQERMLATNSRNFRGYFSMLRLEEPANELQELVNSLTVNETYFMREAYQFKCLVQSILPELVAKKAPGSRIRIWCIPSSSGEEPYTLAMYMLEHWNGIHEWDVELISSDIDTAILEKARQGRYSSRAVQLLPDHWLKKYFSRIKDDFQLIADIRTSVEFTHANLTDPNQTQHYREFDIIFCRNLLIYFDDASRKVAAKAFFEALCPGGFILLGHSESMSRISDAFAIRKFPDAIVYQRPEGSV